MAEKKTYNLEDRLINFACLCLDVCDLLPNSKAGQNLEFQLSKSSTATALIMEKHKLLNLLPIFCIKLN